MKVKKNEISRKKQGHEPFPKDNIDISPPIYILHLGNKQEKSMTIQAEAAEALLIREIAKRSIVSICDDSDWCPYQGLVVEPNSNIEGGGYKVGVFFDREVHSTRFWLQSQKMPFSVDDWDQKYGDDYPEILFRNNFWVSCPRVVFFRPEDLTVEQDWGSVHLATRYCGKHWECYTIKFPLVPGSHACWIKDCIGLATHRTFCNIWGVVSELYTCEACFLKFNKMRADSLPPLKKPLPEAA